MLCDVYARTHTDTHIILLYNISCQIHFITYATKIK